MKTNTSHLNIKFTGQEHQIESNTLINTLIHYNSLITRVNDIIGEGSYDVSIKVSAPERGSFVVDISIVTSIVQKLFNREVAEYAANVGTAAMAVYGLYSAFKGKPIKADIDKDKIAKVTNSYVNSTINKTTIINTYNDSIVRATISDSIETASDDTAIEGLELSKPNSDVPSVIIDKERFSELIYDDFDKEDGAEEHGIKHIEIPDAILSIMVAAFDGKSKWRFLYNGNKLPAISIKDTGLQNKIDPGKAFAKGDYLRVILEITQEFNPSYNAYENKKYRIIEVLEHIPRTSQGDLSDSL